MVTSGSVDITTLLKAWSAGDCMARDQMMPLVYNELKRLARRCMRKERTEVTLQATALVHEAYLRLVGPNQIEWRDRAHFFALGAQTMRRILVDAARARTSSKRGGQAGRLPEFTSCLDIEDLNFSSTRDRELIRIDEALDAMAQFDGRKARVIELRFFGGLSVEEAAAVLQVSPQTVMRDWRLAKAWLTRELTKHA
ncbi:MAG: sigma-70 family RNA polymerase sigma factor [Bryobacteraceae bacterium]